MGRPHGMAVYVRGREQRRQNRGSVCPTGGGELRIVHVHQRVEQRSMYLLYYLFLGIGLFIFLLDENESEQIPHD